MKQQQSALIPPFFLFVLLISFPLVYSVHPDFVVLSIMIDKPAYFDQLASWLDTLNCHDFTFVIWENSFDYILDNATRLNKLLQYGEVIPRFAYPQTYTPEERITKMDTILNRFKEKLGYYPKGIMSFVPDTLVANHVKQYDVLYYQGYCFDQYAIDYMTMRGGWQMPYYASEEHILIPSDSDGIIILPHLTFDWIDTFKVKHEYSSHVISVLNLFSDPSDGKNYFINLIERSLAGSEPFGYVSLQFEWGWLYEEGYTDEALDWLRTLITTKRYDYRTFSSFAEWFKLAYTKNPSYSIHFTSPNSGNSIEWYWSNKFRVARIESNVVSYVDYTDQQNDKYLSCQAYINWMGSHDDPNNCVDYSLKFKIDALGGAPNRAPIKTSSYRYTGDLSKFNVEFEGLKPTRDVTVEVGIMVGTISALLGLLIKFRGAIK